MANLKKNANPERAKLMAGPPEVMVNPVWGSPGVKAGHGNIAVVLEVPVTDASAFEKATLPLKEHTRSK